MIIYDRAENILNTLRNWRLEMNSPYNDGWVQEGYREKLSKVEAFFKEHICINTLADGTSANNDSSCAAGVSEDEKELYETYGGD